MKRQHLIIFTRYPQPGRTKTRLIPAVGSEGAAALQRDMTRHVIGIARQCEERSGVSIEVRFEGGDATQMESAFGSGLLYREQGPGDLGDRLQRAFADASGGGAERIIAIGADCPEITGQLLEDAFQRLTSRDLVIGPASDGGYYLIGLRRPEHALFADVSWGEKQVLEQTLCRARQLSMTTDQLEMLSDVDRPEDLSVWQRVKCRADSPAPCPELSVVIPTLNEAGQLPHTLAQIWRARNIEVIVVDGGSQDGTLEIAERAGCRVLCSAPGRAQQLNTGAESASGEILLFVHADTRLPQAFESGVRSALSESGVVAGAFRLRIDSPGLSMRLIEQAVNIRSRLFQMPYGDQCIFVRKQLFSQLGGFPLLPIMDDYEFVRRVRRHGKVRVVPSSVITSGRRWQRLGPWRTTWINQKVILGYHLGLAPERLATSYRADADPASRSGTQVNRQPPRS